MNSPESFDSFGMSSEEMGLMSSQLSGTGLNTPLEDNSSLIGLKKALRTITSSSSRDAEIDNASSKDSVEGDDYHSTSNNPSFSLSSRFKRDSIDNWILSNQSTNFTPVAFLPSIDNTKNTPPTKTIKLDPLTGTSNTKTSSENTAKIPTTSTAPSAGDTLTTSSSILPKSLPPNVIPIGLNLLSSSDSGISGDNITNDNTPTIGVNIATGLLVRLFDNQQTIGQSILSNPFQVTTKPLADGVHTITGKALGLLGNLLPSTSTSLQLTIDTLLPQLNLTTDVEDTLFIEGSHLTGIVDGTGTAIASLSYHFDNLNSTPILFNSVTGEFDAELNLAGLNSGVHVLTLVAVDKAGNTLTTNLEVEININLSTSDIVLKENSDFKVTASQAIEIPDTPSILSFKLADIDFDTTDKDSIKDAFEVALVDESGNSLVHSIGKGRDSFFNLTESQPIALAPGAKFNDRFTLDLTELIPGLVIGGDKVSVDLSQITPGTDAKLVFRLVNNDDDTKTEVRLRQVKISPKETTDIPVSTGVPEAGTPAEKIDFKKLTDVSSSMTATYFQTSFNEDSKTLYTDLSVKNEGQYLVRGPLLVGVTNISDPTVRLKNADGVTPDGISYFDYSKLVTDRLHQPGEVTAKKTLQFYNPQSVQFTYDLVFLSQLNSDPEFTTEADIEAIVGKPYVYDADATDPDNDTLTYSLVSGPDGMSIDSETGEITWSPTAENKGTHNVIVKVEDGLGGEATQQYVLSTIDPPPNRPPQFTSTPVVDGNVNTPYTYQATALDVDGDNLTFTKVDGPEGLDIDPVSGEVAWMPDATQLGIQDVTLQVTDNQGGITLQRFQILIQMEPLNRPPIITSEPETKAYPTKNYTYQVFAADPDFDKLTYELVNPPSGMTIDPYTGKITWNDLTAINAGQYEIAVKALDNRGGVDTQNFLLNVSQVLPGQIAGKVYKDEGKPLDTLVYFNDFEDPDRPLTEWSNPIKDVTPKGDRHFLGRYGINPYGDPDGKTSLTLTDLPSHDTVTLSFQTYAIQSWDGNADWGVGPDWFEVNVDGGPTLLHTTFLNVDGYWRSFGVGQAYPNSYPGSNLSSRTGAVESNTLGYGYYGDSVYNLTFTFEHSEPNLNLNFLGIATYKEGLTNESWGLDDVQVRVGSKAEGLANSIVYIDNNNNAQRDSDEPKTLTDAQGKYSFTLDPGNYTVAQELPLGWTQTKPTSNSYNVTLESGQEITGLDFGNTISTAENAPPTFLSQPKTEAVVGQKFYYRSVAKDPNSDLLSYDLVVKPDGMVVDTTTGVIGWQPAADQIGTHDVTLRVSDGLGEQDLQSFKVKVTPSNSSPIFFTGPGNGLPLNPTATVGQPFQYQASAQDADNDPITYSLKQPPAQASIDSKTGVFTWKPQDTQVGSHPITIIASDERGGVTTQSFNLEVLQATPNEPPVITTSPRKTIGLSQPYRYTAFASDPNNDPLAYKLVSAPDGMTIDSMGRVFWKPKPSQFGPNQMRILVEDGRGGEAVQDEIINVVSQPTNQPPSIESTPNLAASVNRLYEYDLKGSDPDNDPLLWSLEKAPESMSIDPERGAIRWIPTPEKVGKHEVVVRAIDTFGAVVQQAFTVTVRGTNVPPAIVSTPPTTAAVDKTYRYAVLAKDVENDFLKFSLIRKPDGMNINPDGLIEWRPSGEGEQEVEILVEDSFGGIATQRYKIVVDETAANQPPAITSTPKLFATVGSQYQYAVTAIDPEGETPLIELLEKPEGMTFEQQTGTVQWTPTASGDYTVKVRTRDSAGASGVQQFTITADINNPPTITSASKNVVTAGLPYRYDVRATDPDGDPLTFTLDNPPAGMTVDKFGRISWSPENEGIYPINITVADNHGATVNQSYDLTVQKDEIAPTVKLLVSQNPVNKGEQVTFTVDATDNVGVESLNLTVNNEPVALDAQGRATLPMNSTANVEAIATASDAAGNSSAVTRSVNVIDSSDGNAPDVALTPINEPVSDKINIVGKVADDNLDSYTLSIAPIEGGEFTVIARGNTTVDGVLAELDPNKFANGSYLLRLEAKDFGNNISTIEGVVDIASDFKLGNLQLSFTDLEIPLEGIPIKVTRIYDSLNASRQQDLGYGWRLDFRDTDLQANVPFDEVAEELGYYTVPFEEATRVYLNVPGGKREVFTFNPYLDATSEYLAKYSEDVSENPESGEGLIYHPAFDSQKNSTNTLSVKKDAYITKTGNEYYGLNGEPYNPVNPEFGQVYVLTTAEGIVYEIDAISGDLLTATAPNGTKLTHSNAGISSNTGISVPFGRDAKGRIVTVTAPDNKQILYGYDSANGDLITVTDKDSLKTEFIYNETDKPHYLIKVIGDDGQVKYNQTGDGSINRPPEVTAGEVKTHKDLEIEVDLTKYATDPDGDSISFSVDNPTGGTVQLSSDGKKAIFKPAPGVTGEGSFKLTADDGKGSPNSVTIKVNISDAPLLNLDFSDRDVQLDTGESAELVVLGDFADEKDVVLPDSFVSYSSETPEIALIDDTGLVTGNRDGVSILKASRDNLKAVTALRVGELPTPTDDASFNVALAETMGLDVYPGAVTLTEGATRKLLVGIDETVDSPDLETSDGTRYEVSNPNVLQVSEDGVVTALNEGVANVTVIHGAAEEVVPVLVDAPQLGAATLGEDGGAVRSNDGAMVTIAPGALTEDTTVSIQQVSQLQLPLPIPEKFSFAGAFKLDVGDDPLAVPAQIAIPAPASLQPGTEVFFLRSGELPVTGFGDEWVGTDTLRPMWMLEESGVVGEDGMIRTSSPPWRGAEQSGEYSIVVPQFKYSVERVELAKAAFTAGIFLITAGIAINGYTPKFLPRQLKDIYPTFSPLLVGGGFGLSFVVAPLLLASAERTTVNVLTVPTVGLPYTTPSGVNINPGQLCTLTAEIPPPLIPEAVAITKLEVMVPPSQAGGDVVQGRVVFLTGNNFGSNLNDLTVNFLFGGKTYPGTILPEFTDLSQGRIAVQSDIVPLREADVSVEKTLRSAIGTETKQNSEQVKIPVERTVEQALVPLTGSDKVNVINALNPESVIAQTSSMDLLVASIPVGTGDEGDDGPRHLAVTNDTSRAYVPLELSGKVAVIDVMGLKQLDSNPDNDGINPIDLPAGAKPFFIVIDSEDRYAYIGDRQRGAIYVLDIDPVSEDYNKCVQTIEVEDAFKGIGQMAINSDGTRLFVTAPLSSESGKGQILVFNINPEDRNDNSQENPSIWPQQIGKVEAGSGLEGISATSDPLLMLFTNRNEDARGLGVLTIANNDSRSFAATVKYVPLTLGSIHDYFDVNEAVAVTVTRDKKYAFVASRNSRFIGSGVESVDGERAGSNIGIIKDPFGENPVLVAATRPIPGGLTSDVGLSSNDKYLYASYPGIKSTFGFDVEEIIKTVEETSPDVLTSTPIDDINPAINMASDFKILSEDPQTRQVKFGVPDGSNRGPIATEDEIPFSVAMASKNRLVEIVSPIDKSEWDKLTPPTFQWKIYKPADNCEGDACNPEEEDPQNIKKVKLYVSVFDENNGLLPDEWRPENGQAGVDYNPNRILTATWENNKWTWSNGELSTTNYEEFTLPDDRSLTAGQKYHWAVEVETKNGKDTVTSEFDTELPPALNSQTFSSVTVLTRGVEPESERTKLKVIEIDGEKKVSTLLDEELNAIAKYIANNNGSIMAYDWETHEWKSQNNKNPEPGKPLVLLPNWTILFRNKLSYNSGFAEAAADTLFASLVKLNKDKQSQIFNSPLHFIGFGQGSVVNSEIIQRIGTFFPDAYDGGISGQKPDLQMTSVDPHDYDDKSPQEETLKYVKDPLVKVWENVTFADNYFQDLQNQQLRGKQLEDGDWDVQLNSRAGFTPNETAGAPHIRALDWYTGTTNVNKDKVPPQFTEVIYRRLGDLEQGNPNKTLRPWYTPDHTKADFKYGAKNAPWEGIGTGWFYSKLGGGSELRPYYEKGKRRKDELEGGFEEYIERKRTKLNVDNTFERRMRGDYVVPTLFNGNFDAIYAPVYSQLIPGWSIYNAPNSVTKNNALQQHLVTWEQMGNQSDSFKDYLTKINYNSEQVNYALKLGGSDGPRAITHNYFIMPEWGDLRFNLHVPEDKLNSNVTLKVSVKGENSEVAETFKLIKAEKQINTYTQDKTQIGYGVKGFETFRLNIPKNKREALKNQKVTLTFQLVGLDYLKTAVYLDDIFFKSDELRLGNPTEARYDAVNSPTNFLVEKAQYSLSYNSINNTANWVSWRMNKSWLGDENYRADFKEDPDISSFGWFQAGQDNYTRNQADLTVKYPSGNQRFLVGGHLAPVADRSRDRKDLLTTYLTSNIAPQEENFNSVLWKQIEQYLRDRAANGRDYYIIAGVDGTNTYLKDQAGNPKKYIELNGNTDEKKHINVPSAFWKVVIELPKVGASIEQATDAFAVYIENKDFRRNWREPRDLLIMSIKQLQNRLNNNAKFFEYKFLSEVKDEEVRKNLVEDNENPHL